MTTFIITNNWNDLKFVTVEEGLTYAVLAVGSYLFKADKDYREEVGEDEYHPEDTLYHEYRKADVGKVPEGFAFTEVQPETIIEL